MRPRKATIAGGVLLALLLGAAGFLLGGCTARPSQGAAGSRPLQVTADFYPMAEFARQVGGDRATITTLVKAGMEPHDFEPLPRDIATLLQSQIFVYNGAGMDPWVDRLLPDLRQGRVTVVKASAGLPLLAATPEEQATGTNTDPHVWLDPVLAKREVDHIAAGFIARDPAHRRDYTAHATAYKARLDGLDADFRKGLSTCARRDIITSHAAFGYLARRYGLNQVAISGLSPDTEPSPRQLAEISRFARAHQVHTIFFETLVSPRLAQTIASETGANTLVLNPLESLTKAQQARGEDYLSLQRQNLNNLRIALECR